MSFGNSYIVQHYSGHIQDERDTLKDKSLTLFNLSTGSISPPSSQSLFTGQGRLKVFNCDIILTGPSQVSAVRTVFYDTSGVPTGTEPVLFSIISFAQKQSSVTEGFSQHSYNFPERGVVFENGIGLSCSVLYGTPTIAFVDANFGYVATDDDYP